MLAHPKQWDAAVRLDFDLTATARLWFYDLDRDKKMSETSIMNQIGEAMGGQAKVDDSKAEHW